MTVRIGQDALNLREELAALRNQGSYQEQQFYFDGLVTNGTFDSATTGWTATRGASLASVSSQLVVTCGATTSAAAATQAITTNIGVTYTLVVTIVGKSGGRARVGVGINSELNVNSTYTDVIDIANGVYSVTFTATATTSYVHLSQQDQNFTATFDNISVFEVDASNDVIHTMPKGWKPKDVYEDGLLQREGAAHDYEVVYNGFDYFVKPAVAPSATTTTCVIGVKA